MHARLNIRVIGRVTDCGVATCLLCSCANTQCLRRWLPATVTPSRSRPTVKCAGAVCSRRKTTNQSSLSSPNRQKWKAARLHLCVRLVCFEFGKATEAVRRAVLCEFDKHCVFCAPESVYHPLSPSMALLFLIFTRLSSAFAHSPSPTAGKQTFRKPLTSLLPAKGAYLQLRLSSLGAPRSQNQPKGWSIMKGPHAPSRHVVVLHQRCAVAGVALCTLLAMTDFRGRGTDA